MSGTDRPFSERIDRIARRRRALSRGAVQEVGPDGLVVLRRRRRFSPASSLRGLVLVLCTGLVFKAFLLVHLGESGYEAKRASLAAAMPVAQAFAVVMRPDAATRAIAAAWIDATR